MAERAPKKLGAAGRALWRRVQGDLGEDLELDEREVAILTLACRQADDVAGLEALLLEQGSVTTGSKGQVRLNAALAEVRLGRQAVAKLLGQLDLAETPAATAASRRGRKAAQSRWRRHDEPAPRREANDGA